MDKRKERKEAALKTIELSKALLKEKMKSLQLLKIHQEGVLLKILDARILKIEKEFKVVYILDYNHKQTNKVFNTIEDCIKYTEKNNISVYFTTYKCSGNIWSQKEIKKETSACQKAGIIIHNH